MVSILIVLLFAGYAWILYREKVQASDRTAHQPSNPAATPYDAVDASSTNASVSSLSPVAITTNWQ